MFITSYQIVHARSGPDLGFAPDGIARLDELPDFRVLVLEIAEDQGVLGRRLHAGRLFPDGQTLGAEGALLHHALGTGRIFPVRQLGFQIGRRPRIAVVEAARAVGTGRHAEPAADAAVHVHHHDAVLLALERRLGRADPDAGRFFAVVA